MEEVENKKPSFEKINYSLRPAKNIERKMIIEALHRLSFFEPVKNYMYIGFGSVFFTDFSLFHRQMGIDSLYSIELEKDLKDRFEFNKPFHSINIIYKHSNDALKDPCLNWSQRKILWLDYDYQITADVIVDIDQSIKKCRSGDVILLTLNAASKSSLTNPKTSDNSKEKVLTKFKEQFKLIRGEDEIIDFSSVVDASVVPSDLAEWGLANVCSDIINKRIYDGIKERNEFNEDSPEYKKLTYKKIFDFHYADGVKMMTVGYIIYDESEEVKYLSCKFKDFKFCDIDDGAYLIEAPNLTMKEVQYVDSYLPSNLEDMDYKKIPIDDINNYEKVYRYYPAFLESFH